MHNGIIPRIGLYKNYGEIMQYKNLNKKRQVKCILEYYESWVFLSKTKFLSSSLITRLSLGLLRPQTFLFNDWRWPKSGGSLKRMLNLFTCVLWVNVIPLILHLMPPQAFYLYHWITWRGGKLILTPSLLRGRQGLGDKTLAPCLIEHSQGLRFYP
jgi:hypothetical protein